MLSGNLVEDITDFCEIVIQFMLKPIVTFSRLDN